MAEAIERKILAGRLKPGDPVGTESELVRQFGVNRSTVREGIRLLEQSGLVAREPSRRLSVAVPHYHRLASRMTRALILQQVTFRELWHTSRALEPAAVDQAMDNATEEDLAELAANVDKTRKLQGDPAAVAELDAEFHKLIGKAAHNRVLLLAKEPSGMLVRPTTALIIVSNPQGIPRLIEAHAHILDALQRRDREKGRLWVDRHLRDWKAGFERSGPRSRHPRGARSSAPAAIDAPPRPDSAAGIRLRAIAQSRDLVAGAWSVAESQTFADANSGMTGRGLWSAFRT